GAPPEPAAACPHVRDVARRLLPLLPHRAIAHPVEELGMRQERAGHLPETRRDPLRRTGDERAAVAAARDRAAAGGEMIWSTAGYQPAGARATSPRRQVAGAPAGW